MRSSASTKTVIATMIQSTKLWNQTMSSIDGDGRLLEAHLPRGWADRGRRRRCRPRQAPRRSSQDAGAADRINRMSTSIGVSAPSIRPWPTLSSRNFASRSRLRMARHLPARLRRLGIAPRTEPWSFSNHNSAPLAMRLWGSFRGCGRRLRGRPRRHGYSRRYFGRADAPRPVLDTVAAPCTQASARMPQGSGDSAPAARDAASRAPRNVGHIMDALIRICACGARGACGAVMASTPALTRRAR